jgi:ubiquinone/menaquinone biosynthesis C-methylase UbiE
MGISPKVLVTGLGVSGTTYMIRLIGACGFDLGQGHHGMDDRKGWEWQPLWKLSVEIWSALGRRAYEPIIPEWNHIQPERLEELREQFHSRIEALECPHAVKVPEASPILISCLRPGHVIFMHRPMNSWVRSLLGHPNYCHMTRSELFHGAMIAKGLLLDALESEQIPYTVVSYPRIAKDAAYAWDKLGRLLQVDREVFDAAYNSVTRSDWIDWTITSARTSSNPSQQTLQEQVSEAPQPAVLSWTGERVVPTESGQTAVEHLHRYAIAADLANGKTVLDIASGEGYGANLLASTAGRVIGIDIAPEAVRHAHSKYCRHNLTFIVGECGNIPIDTSTVDLVVSFETLEHHAQHEAMIAEFARVLRPGGAVIISSPNKREYSDIPKYKNPFHVAELYLDQFESLLKSHFRNVYVFGQRVSSGSCIAPIRPYSEALKFPYRTYTGTFSLVRSEYGIDRPIYFIAVASDAELPTINAGLFEGESFLLQHKEQVITSLTDQSRLLQAQFADKDQQLIRLREDNTRLQQDNARLAMFADAVRRTVAYRFYRKFIKPLGLGNG